MTDYWIFWTIAAAAIFAATWKAVRAMGGAPAPRPAEQKPLRSAESKTGLKTDVLREGTGRAAKPGDKLTVHYRAWIQGTNQEVDSSYDRGRPLDFTLGNREVIDGWEEGLKGMKAGEKRQITLPAKLAYGSKGSPSGKVPPGATLVFELELVKMA